MTEAARPDPALRQEAFAEIQRKIEAENARVSRYGKVRPIIHLQTEEGYRVVAVGSRMWWSKKWRFFTDFLMYFLKATLGWEWGKAELEKPLKERHVIMQWFEAFREMVRRHPAGPDGVGRADADGPTQALFSLAYDLYLLGDHQKLRDRLIARLKDPRQFQGARYELYVATVLIRAGFQVEVEDETDSSRPHLDFIATFTDSGEKIEIEAKSRHLPGILGRPGVPPDDGTFRLDIRQLVREALAKLTTLPYVVFIDANMPPEYARRERMQWMKDANSAVNLGDRNYNEVGIRVKSGVTLVVVTNVPHHYGEVGAALPEPIFLMIWSGQPERPFKDGRIRPAVEEALSITHNVPQEFPAA